MTSSFWTTFIILIIIFHFVFGFAYLVFKLSPREGDKMKQAGEKEEGEV